MKKKILIILPLVIVACIIILVIPKNNNIVETAPQDAVETSEVSEPTQEPEKAPEPQPEVIEPEPETTEPEQTETVEDGINSTHTDIELGDDEYKGDTGTDALKSEYDSLSEEEQEMVDQIVEDMMKEHPEWFAETSGNNNKAPGYVSVDAPVDNGELPNTGKFGQGDYSEGAGAQVY